jgi:hypothetical protein
MAAQASNRAIVKQKRVTWNLRFSEFSYMSLEIATDHPWIAAPSAAPELCGS